MEDCTLGLLPYTVSVRYLVAVVRKVTKPESYFQKWGCCCSSPDQMDCKWSWLIGGVWKSLECWTRDAVNTRRSWLFWRELGRQGAKRNKDRRDGAWDV